jgi:hypothetical protein
MRAAFLSLVSLLLPTVLPAQRVAARMAESQVSAPVSGIAYTVEFTRPTAVQRSIRVVTTMTTAGRGNVLLSLPAWTPGAYEVSHFARNVSGSTCAMASH